ncbi:uncharacterized protein LOC104879359 [Vitis vinifera]|uniref:Uncharacterized protein n=1 Tax=Vitis vinifera TaxID=29760 RepID=A0A438EC88_VITVI|nr:uncharacterized protein LOC104879359 [Vitis vinifera]RVW45421.1 hypothetical protein CK203_106863 [Vitis vinifera]
MEDWNMLAADCVVISCCCQCLILQMVVFVLLKLPYKLFRKTKEYAKKKLMLHGRRQDRGTEREMKPYEDEFREIQGGLRIQVEGGFPEDGSQGCGCCMEEVERVLEEYSQRGEFAFGSFWAMPNIAIVDLHPDNHLDA